MSNIALVSPAAGTATFSITTPSGTSTDRTLTLPDSAGTLDTLQRAGNVIQVVSATKTDGIVSVATTDETDVFSVSITPTSSSSKILVMCAFNIWLNSSGLVAGITKLVRGSTELMQTKHRRESDGTFKVTPTEFNYLDSPNATSSVTYKITCLNSDISGGTPDYNRENNELTITLMEIAA
jgi:hypothetical protein